MQTYTHTHTHTHTHTYTHTHTHTIYTHAIYTQGRKPREDGGRFPPKLRLGEGPCIRPPNILRSSVVGCARKYEKSKKKCFYCEERVMYEGSCTTFNKVKIRKISENSKNMVDD